MILDGFHHQTCNFFGEFRVVVDQLDGGVAALGQSAAVVAEPASALLDDVVLHTEVHKLAGFVDALAEENVELTNSYNVRKAPTLLVPNGDQILTFENASNIKGYIESLK